MISIAIDEDYVYLTADSHDPDTRAILTMLESRVAHAEHTGMGFKVPMAQVEVDEDCTPPESKLGRYATFTSPVLTSRGL